MTGECEITGLNPEDVNNWSDLHRYITGTLELSTPSEESLSSFNKPLNNTVSNHKVHPGDAKRRESLIQHLERSISRKIKGSKLIPFGSNQTGMSLKGGDLDLCLSVNDDNPKKILKRISGMMRGQGMENVKPLMRAKIPIVKFTDPRSGIDVDISINNSLALHNTRLMTHYVSLDQRVKQVAICVKHWALHRHLSDAPSGTLSSYAWSLLVVQHLQLEGIIPNIQAGEDRTLVEVEGVEYDLTIDTEVSSNGDKSKTLEQLLFGFFSRYATWNWDDDIVSIRNGSPISRDQKGWLAEKPSALDVITSKKDRPPRVGAHHLAIEDPFDLDHDLCRVVWASGELKIRNELLRAARLFGEGQTWKAICETVDSERLAGLEPTDIFADLRTKSDDEVKQMKDVSLAESVALETRIEALESERSSAIRMAKAMRGVIEETSGLKKEHKAIIVGLKTRNKEIDSLKNQRDLINANIIIPVHMIEDELAKVYTRLTEESDIHRVPSLNREKNQFSWFLELQAMHGKAREATELHQRFIDLVKEQKGEIKKLKIFESKHDETTTKLLEDEPMLKDKNINKNEARSFDRRVQNIQKALRQRRGEMHGIRRELGRLDAWLRKKSNSSSHRPARPANKKKESKPANAPMTLGDISGMFAAIESKTDSKKTRKSSAKKAGMRKLGNLSAHRGTRNTYTKKDSR